MLLKQRFADIIEAKKNLYDRDFLTKYRECTVYCCSALLTSRVSSLKKLLLNILLTYGSYMKEIEFIIKKDLEPFVNCIMTKDSDVSNSQGAIYFQ